MPTEKQPERGTKSPYSVRYLVDIPGCSGIDLSHDPSTIDDTALRQGINCRVHDGIVLNRGGQTAIPNSPGSGCIQGLIDIDGVGTRAVLADNEKSPAAGITFLDENLPSATNYTSISSEVTEHPAQGDQNGGSFQDAKPRYVYQWWDGYIVFQDVANPEKELHKLVLPENDITLTDEIQAEALFPCLVPGEAGPFTVTSMTTMPQVTNVTTQPLYFGTLAGGVVGYINGQMRRLLADATFSGRVIVFQYNNRLYAAGADDLWVQNGWTAGNDAASSSWTQVSLPVGPTDFRPMCGIEWGGYGWIGGYDDATAGGAVNSGYILRINDSSGSPVVTVALNDVGGALDWLQSVDDFAVGLSNKFIIGYRWRTSGGSAFGDFNTWDGASAVTPQGYGWGESEGMVQRMQGTNDRIYISGYGSDSTAKIVSWADAGSPSTIHDFGGNDQSPFDMVLF